MKQEKGVNGKGSNGGVIKNGYNGFSDTNGHNGGDSVEDLLASIEDKDENNNNNNDVWMPGLNGRPSNGGDHTEPHAPKKKSRHSANGSNGESHAGDNVQGLWSFNSVGHWNALKHVGKSFR